MMRLHAAITISIDRPSRWNVVSIDCKLYIYVAVFVGAIHQAKAMEYDGVDYTVMR